MSDFQSAYSLLEKKIELHAQGEGSVYLPNLTPAHRVDYLFVAMEPSLGWWAGSNSHAAEEAEKKVRQGFKNFLWSYEDFLFHWCIRTYLCGIGDYHLTDISKGAMTNREAETNSLKRYEEWYPLLKEEVKLVGSPGVKVFAVGRAVKVFLDSKKECWPWSEPIQILHYTRTAASHRKIFAEENKDQFSHFLNELPEGVDQGIKAVASDLVKRAKVSSELRQDILDRLKKADLTESRRQLLFYYKTIFTRANGRGILSEPSQSIATAAP